VVAEALQKPKSTYDEFVEDFNDLQSRNKFIISAKVILGHELNKDDLEEDNIVGFIFLLFI
jgi:DNA (cytosine-5)-methyltransferase 1